MTPPTREIKNAMPVVDPTTGEILYYSSEAATLGNKFQFGEITTPHRPGLPAPAPGNAPINAFFRPDQGQSAPPRT